MYEARINLLLRTCLVNFSAGFVGRSVVETFYFFSQENFTVILRLYGNNVGFHFTIAWLY